MDRGVVMLTLNDVVPARWLRALLLAACAGACVLPAAHAGDDGWKRVRPSEPVLGLDKRVHSASCSAYPGTDSSYAFWARKGKSRNLVVYFEGGGACWNDQTCSVPGDGSAGDTGFYTPAVTPASNPAQLGGMFNLDRDDNPVKDWDMVYIPYCTGDLHSGRAVQRYYNPGVPGLPAQFNIRHMGFANTMVVLDWMKRNLDTPRNVLVAGSSAGGYGATINFAWVRKLYPQAQFNVLSDASQGITTPAFDTGGPRVGRGSWQTQMPPWAAGVDPASIPGPQLMHAAAVANPGVRMAQFTTAFDNVQIAFYGLMLGCLSLDGSCAGVPVDWYSQMVTGVLTDAATLPNYRVYLAAGEYHTVLTGPEFYTERSTGTAFKNWLDAMLNGTRRWRNEVCPGCLP